MLVHQRVTLETHLTRAPASIPHHVTARAQVLTRGSNARDFGWLLLRCSSSIRSSRLLTTRSWSRPGRSASRRRCSLSFGGEVISSLRREKATRFFDSTGKSRTTPASGQPFSKKKRRRSSGTPSFRSCPGPRDAKQASLARPISTCRRRARRHAGRPALTLTCTACRPRRSRGRSPTCPRRRRSARPRGVP